MKKFHKIKIGFLVVLLQLAFAGVVFASEYKNMAGKIPSVITVENNKKIDREAISQKIKTKIGEKITTNSIKNDIKTIYDMGYFEFIEVVYDEDKNELIYRVKERPSITKIDFEGNTQFKNDDLKEVIKLKEYEIYDPKRVQNDIDAITKHYEEKGYYLAKITSEIKKTDKPDEVNLKFVIRDFDKVKIRKITFLNNKVFSDEELKKAFKITNEASFWSWMSGKGHYRENAFKADVDFISLFYLDHGYVKFKQDPAIVNLSEDKKWAYVTIKVDEGKQYKVGKIDFTGDLLFAKEDLMSALTLKETEIFSLTKRNADIQTLSEKYQDLGYAFVNVVPEFEFNDDAQTVNINYNFDKGKLVHFRRFIISGNTKTRDKVIRRELKIFEGELYNGTNLRKSKENVERLGFFGQNEVVFQTKTVPGSDDLVDILVSVKERGTGTFTFGVGYSTISGVYINSNISENNLFGRGQVLSFGLNMSVGGNDPEAKKDKSFNLGFVEPYFLDSDFSLGGDVFYTDSHIPGRFRQINQGFDIKSSYPLAEYTRLYWTYKLSHQGIKDVQRPATEDEALEKGYLSSIALTLERDKRNNRMEPTKGNYQSITFEYAGLGGDKYFGTTKGALRWYMPVFDTDLIYRSNYEAGNVFKIYDDKKIPSSAKNYLGGPSSLKGYDFYSISPKDPTGQVSIGGNIFAFTSQEFEYPLIREAGLKWVMFFDAGNVWDTLPNQLNGIRLKADVGFGFRWFSPIGPLRFEWGFPINPKGNEPSSQFQFYIGPPF